ncbi:lipid-binding protein [Proteiniphilum acetatigenes]|uniref:lipid-binding protein n=1 Tax=Proteiniphilum acetatigenes TaxID=294710 RepID=UPI00036EA849|nr:lipid-binding protein [Proteiniphilum acetatigenes]SFS36531.1 Lipid-binding putative hydrolase [Porphyromonadaceae bacterium NLAE-zl-C104]
MKKITYLLGFLAIGILVSCEKEADNGATDDASKPVNITGQWEVTAYNDSTLIFGPFKVITLKDTSAQSDSITIQDTEVKFWKFQTKAFVDEKNGTFHTELSNCEVSEEAIGIKISNGKIFNSDSIYFEIQFEDDETPYKNTFQLKGHRISE